MPMASTSFIRFAQAAGATKLHFEIAGSVSRCFFRCPPPPGSKHQARGRALGTDPVTVSDAAVNSRSANGAGHTSHGA